MNLNKLQEAIQKIETASCRYKNEIYPMTQKEEGETFGLELALKFLQEALEGGAWMDYNFRAERTEDGGT